MIPFEASPDETAGATHDLKNLFWVLDLQADHLETHILDNPAGAELIEVLRQVVADGRSITKVLDGRARREGLSGLRVADAVKCVEDMSRALLPAFPQGFSLGVRIEDGLHDDVEGRVLPITAMAFRRCVLNLLRNAREALPSRGSVSIRVERGTGPRKGLVLQVSDSGVGIPPENLSRIFDAGFTSKPRNGAEGPVGAGLGLANVQSIVEEAGGELRVASEPSKGCRLEIWFPYGTKTSQDCAK